MTYCLYSSAHDINNNKMTPLLFFFFTWNPILSLIRFVNWNFLSTVSAFDYGAVLCDGDLLIFLMPAGVCRSDTHFTVGCCCQTFISIRICSVMIISSFLRSYIIIVIVIIVILISLHTCRQLEMMCRGILFCAVIIFLIHSIFLCLRNLFVFHGLCKLMPVSESESFFP